MNPMKFDFGDYVTIEQKRFGTDNEFYLYKVIGRLRSNCYVDVPVQAAKGEMQHRGLVDVLLCICCGVSETEVLRFRESDVRPVPGKYEEEQLPYGIIDPDYAKAYTIIRKLAWDEGYAIGLHGSFTRDLDLVAVPWAETVSEPDHLITRITNSCLELLQAGEPTPKPHGRIAYTLYFEDFGDPRFIDLSIVNAS